MDLQHLAVLNFDFNHNIIGVKNFNSISDLRFPKYAVSKTGNKHAIGFHVEEDICINGQIYSGQNNQNGIILLTY